MYDGDGEPVNAFSNCMGKQTVTLREPGINSTSMDHHARNTLFSSSAALDLQHAVGACANCGCAVLLLHRCIPAAAVGQICHVPQSCRITLHPPLCILPPC